MTFVNSIRQQFPCPNGYAELVYPKVGDTVYNRLTNVPRQIVEIRDNLLFTVDSAGLIYEENAIWYLQKVG